MSLDAARVGPAGTAVPRSGAVRIGIDVGGTNTDAVALRDDVVLGSVKRPTTSDVSSGIADSIAALRTEVDFAAADVRAVMVGTTHFTNAVVARSGLARCGVIRLGLPSTSAIPPYADWPADLVAAVRGETALCHGGVEFDARPISELRPDELRAAIDRMAAAGVETVAVSSVFAPADNEHELAVAELISRVLPGVAVSLSHEIGTIGLLERENATILNAALRPLANTVVDAITSAVAGLGLDAPLYLSQNDGTVMDAETCRSYPVRTFASGPTNSMRGAALLSGRSDCTVIDVGGTTSDIGTLVRGFPRRATGAVDIGGVRSNFRMPDVFSIGIGGGSRVRAGAGGNVAVGPDSVGYRLTSDGLVFGGDVLTLTDVAVAVGRVALGDSARVAMLPDRMVQAAMAAVEHRTVEALNRTRTSDAPISLVAVGGGSVLLPATLPGFGEVIRPDHYGAANAVGAAIAQVGAEVDSVVSGTGPSRQHAVQELREQAIDKAVAAGAVPGSVEVIDVDDVPLAYLPGGASRVRVKAVGDLGLELSVRA